MDNKELEDIIALITKQTGIIPRESHRSGIQNFIEKRKKEIDLNGLDYYNYVFLNKKELDFLLNHATVNETYFFREETQFTLLKTKILPELRSKLGIAPVRIWSAAASSGEEIYSLYLLASSLNIKTECIATDINTTVLEKCESGVYTPNSVKAVDGAKFHYLLAPYLGKDKEVILPKEICSKIERRQLNLSKADALFPKDVNLVFLRNVFVYFTVEMRRAIIQKIVNDALAPDGYLFVSTNEIAAIDAAILPKGLEKCSDGNVFYFHKKG